MQVLGYLDCMNHVIPDLSHGHLDNGFGQSRLLCGMGIPRPMFMMGWNLDHIKLFSVLSIVHRTNKLQNLYICYLKEDILLFTLHVDHACIFRGGLWWSRCAAKSHLFLFFFFFSVYFIIWFVQYSHAKIVTLTKMVIYFTYVTFIYVKPLSYPML